MDKVFQQQQNVVLPFAKRGNLDREYVQPVVEVRAKCPVCNGGLQIAISCRNYADIDLDRLRAADTFEFTFLQHPQECNLSVQRQLADFVQENGSSARQFKSTEPALHRPGERALFVAKEFGRNQRWGKSSAVHAHERALRPTRSLMDGAGDQFLTSSSLSTNKNARIGGSNFHHPRKYSLQRRRGADDLFEHERLVDLLPEHYVFVLQLIFQALNLFNRLLQVGSRAVVFRDVHHRSEKFHEVAFLIDERMSDRMEVLDSSVGKNDAVVRFIVCFLDFAPFEEFLNAFCVLRMSSIKPKFSIRLSLIGSHAVYSIHFRRDCDSP